MPQIKPEGEEWCKKLDKCPKIKIVLDKDLDGPWQYAGVIRTVCSKCKERI